MPAYSLDFRKKIVTAYEAGNTSIREVAKRFMVTKRTVQRLIWLSNIPTGHYGNTAKK
ncbi:hypothetical protein Pse7429DRAFT_1075 [Pseudanabaena biceps PCC 7429]|uniref:Insertion element IS150 protein InsJ-like helix-turn-helix domain-containing protein n=1 Tax=Pseudanabaena biceps PCC 7429 TaxID=927668 RepID=L8N3V2_9CYAN|nr:hypothetical protein Pse7429DRAFT_1075 [Pseudanabaena biceps PCC 7429]